MLPDLNSLLKFRHHKVMQNYVRSYSASENKATELFTDMLKYLWLSRKHALDCKQQPDNEAIQFQFVMHEEMRDIDNMWHTFILYTHDYTSFCLSTFGEYLHHVPDIAETISQSNIEFANELEKYLSYVYDHLGEETLHRWFAPYFLKTN